MAAITSITENWSGHSFKEVETHIKGSYLPLTSVSVDSISSGVANVLTLNSSNAVKKTSLSDLASLLGDKMIRFINVTQSNINTDTLQLGTCVFRHSVGATGAMHGNTDGTIFQMTRDKTQYCMFQIGFDYYGVYIRKSWAASSPSWSDWVQLV